ncbi:uncharacterized protein LOC144871379 [Branchiostoma floridae x Branchiostoma japonicum]
MSTEKLNIDGDGYFNHRRGHENGHITLTSLLHVLTACMSVIIIALVVQEGARLRELERAFQGREMKSAVSDFMYQKEVSDYQNEVAQQEVNKETPEARRAGGGNNLQSEPGKARDTSVEKSYVGTDGGVDIPWQTGPAHHQRGKEGGELCDVAGGGRRLCAGSAREGRP